MNFLSEYFKKAKSKTALFFAALGLLFTTYSQAVDFIPLGAKKQPGQNLMQYVYAVEQEYRDYYTLNANRTEAPVNEFVVERVRTQMTTLTNEIDSALAIFLQHADENESCRKVIKKYHANIYDSFKTRALDRAVLAQGGREQILFYAAAVVQVLKENIEPACAAKA